MTLRIMIFLWKMMCVCVCVCVPSITIWRSMGRMSRHFYLILLETHGGAPSFEGPSPHHVLLGPCVVILDSDSGRDTVRGLLSTVDLLDSVFMPYL